MSSSDVVRASAALPRAACNTYASYNELRVQRRDHMLQITINRPEVKNAIRRTTVYELLRALDVGINDAAITVIVLTGAGSAFTTGVDLQYVAQTAAGSSDELSLYLRSANYVLGSLVKKLIYCPKLVVALVHGDCVGLGLTLCALCDVVYCTETAYFWAPFTQLGLCAEACASWTLPQILGRAKATELLCFGTRMCATEALTRGFVAAVLKADQLETHFWPRMLSYARMPAASLRANKKLFGQGAHRAHLLEALRLECIELQQLRRSGPYLAKVAEFARRAKHNKKRARAMERWQGKVAVVTGASAGIGWAIVRELLDAGMRVVGLARRLERMTQARDALPEAAQRVRFVPIQCDLSVLADIEAAFKRIELEFCGQLHVLINNAGMAAITPLLAAGNEAALQRVIDVNLMGTVYCTKQAFRLMQGTLSSSAPTTQCQVINVNSLLGHVVPPHITAAGYNLYPVAKHAMRALNDVLRREFQAVDKLRLRLSNISPGLTDTEFGEIAGVSAAPPTSDIQLRAADVARGISFILASPAHVNIAELLMVPTSEEY